PDAAQHLGEQALGRDAEGERDAGAAAHDVAGERRALGADALEQHRLVVAFERRGDAGQVGGAPHHLELARLLQRLHEAPQAMALAIDPLLRPGLLRLHAPPLGPPYRITLDDCARAPARTKLSPLPGGP